MFYKHDKQSLAKAHLAELLITLHDYQQTEFYHVNYRNYMELEMELPPRSRINSDAQNISKPAEKIWRFDKDWHHFKRLQAQMFRNDCVREKEVTIELE